MGKKILLSILMMGTLSLTGCSSIKGIIQDEIIKKSGMMDDANYQEYEQYVAAGQLDDEGYYIEEAEAEHASVWVTFSENYNLEVQYYTDEAHRTAVDVSNCYLNPGDSIYAVVSINDETLDDIYSFSGFRIYEYDAEGKRILSSSMSMEAKADEYVLVIPKDYTGTDIAIEPIGEYTKRSITLNDYYKDDNGEQHSLSGKWSVNDKECTDDSVEVDPVTSYIISYEYDSDEYFYLSSSPECYYSNNLDGIVIFNQRGAEDETVDYSVELYKYFSITLISDMDRTVKVNNEDAKFVSTNGELCIDHLKFGDIVTIETDKIWPDLENSQELIVADPNPEPLLDGSYRYTLIVPEKGGEFVFNPRDYSYDYGTISFKCLGKTVNNPQGLAKGRRIYYEQASASEGYWLAGNASEHYIVVGEEEETKDALKAIHFTPMVDVTVNLPQPKAGGTVVYKMNGDRIYGDNVSTYSGAEIIMEFEPWEGWYIDRAGESTYTVGESKIQTIKTGSPTIDDIFTEDEGHKPKLTLELEKSVGKTMEFSLRASGFATEVESYGGGWKVTDIFDKDAGKYNLISNKECIVDGEKIGTDQPIAITMSKRAIQSGTAVRMVITTTDKEKNKVSETRYIDDLSKTLEPIYIYQPGQNASSPIWFDSVEINIGVVDIEKYTPAVASEYTKISVSNIATDKVLSDGTLIEGSQKVSVRIVPDAGYYVTGKKVTNDVYSETMTFSEYQKNISNIIKDHAAKKYCFIQLDASDTFADYAYKLDGNNVSGKISAKEGQKLELTYGITDSAYKLTKGYGGFLGIGSSKTKVTKEIMITSGMDGMTVTKDNFDIQVKK